jgi:uncharacterized protein YlzI (FlbEa/FlbD family)
VAVNVNRVQREQEVTNVDCAPYTITLGDGTQHLVTAEEDFYYATLEDLNAVGDQLVEVTTHYINHVKVEPTVADYDFTGLDQITAGEALSLTEPEITEDPVYPAAIIAKGWEISLDGGEFGEYVAGTPVYATNAQVRFKVQTECADEPQYSNLHKITVEKIVNETSFNEVLCPGWLDLPDGSKRFIGADEQFDITVAENEFTDHVYHYDLHVYVQPTVTVEEAPASINAGDVITLPNVTVAEDANYPAPIKDQYWEINLDNAGWIRYYNGAINAHNVQLRYVIEYDHVNANVCFDNLVTEAQLIVVNKVVTPATDEMTVCAGTEVTLASGAKHVVNGEEVFVDRYDVDEFHTTETTYTFHVFVLPTLTVGEAPATITAGDVITLPAVTLSDESNVKDQYWEVNLDNAGWARYYNGAINANNVQLRYVVEFTQCFDDLRSEAQLIVVENNVTDETEEMTVCPGTEVTLRSGAKHVVNGEEVFVDRFVVDAYHTTVTTYTFHVYVAPTVTIAAADNEMTAGDAIVLPTVTLSQETYAAPIREQYWEANLDNNGWNRYNEGTPVYARNVQIRYVVVFQNCFDNFVSASQLINVNKAHSDEDAIDVTQCVGTTYTMANGVVYTFAERQETVVFTIPDPDRFGAQYQDFADKTYTYNFNYLTTPEFELTTLPEGICGEPLILTDPTYTQGANDAALEGEIQWQIRAGEGNASFIPYDGSAQVGSQVVVRYTATTECGAKITSDPMTVILRTPEFDEDDVQIGVQRYGWLLMINKNAIEAEFNRTLEESNVSWYKVVSNADFQSNETNDQFLGNGFYYTTDHSLTGTGEYYAVIEISSVPGTCGATLHSQIFDFNTARESVRLLSTLLTNSDEVTVINLDSETESEVSIVDMTGQTVYRTRTIGTATLTMPAQQSGYYMVRVNGGINDATLKFVVK